MAQGLQDLQAALANQGQKIDEGNTEVKAAFVRLEAKVAAATPDLTNEVTAITAQTAAVQSLIDEAKTKGL